MAKWDPFKDMMALRERMNQLFETSLTRERELAAGLQAGAWSPRADVFETDAGLLVKAELPGVHEEDLEVRLDGGSLVLRGERRMDAARDGDAQISRLEREYGRFQRTLDLPEWASRDPGAVQAGYANGVLEVRVPRRAEGGSTRVAVRAR